MFETLYKDLFLEAFLWARLLIWVILCGLIGVLISWAVFKGFISYSRKSSKDYFDRSVNNHLGDRVRTLFPLLLIYFTLDWVGLDPKASRVVADVLQVLIILNLGWIALKTLNVMEDVFFEEYKIRRNKYLKERRIRTQIRFIKKGVSFLIVVVVASIILLSFEKVQKIGATILTSTAVLGVIIGFASQKTISNLVSGFQIAFTQPIKIDDTVIVEGEWGIVEEITLTYVVVQVWDKRRLVVPINYFVDTVFQNWTRTTEDLIGEVRLFTDPRLPVEAVREELHRYLKDHSLWDGVDAGFQVIDTTERAMVVRATVSSSDAEQCWQLKCDVREHLIAFIREHYPDCLPKVGWGERRDEDPGLAVEG